jgi:hypothetical protein
MANHYHKDEMDFSSGKPICPECKDHKQIEYPERCDCKNTYFVWSDDGKKDIQGQCCCYSKEHY